MCLQDHKIPPLKSILAYSFWVHCRLQKCNASEFQQFEIEKLHFGHPVESISSIIFYFSAFSQQLKPSWPYVWHPLHLCLVSLASSVYHLGPRPLFPRPLQCLRLILIRDCHASWPRLPHHHPHLQVK